MYLDQMPMSAIRRRIHIITPDDLCNCLSGFAPRLCYSSLLNWLVGSTLGVRVPSNTISDRIDHSLVTTTARFFKTTKHTTSGFEDVKVRLSILLIWSFDILSKSSLEPLIVAPPSSSFFSAGAYEKRNRGATIRLFHILLNKIYNLI